MGPFYERRREGTMYPDERLWLSIVYRAISYQRVSQTMLITIIAINNANHRAAKPLIALQGGQTLLTAHMMILVWA